MMYVVLYAVPSGPGSGSSGVSNAVTITPTVASRKIRVWMRPGRVGTMRTS